jgi:type I restriction enzyme S subunit
MMNNSENFKETGFEWIGKIPFDWELYRVGKFFIERNEKVDDVTYPPLSVTMSGIVDQLSEVAKTNDGDNRKLVKKNDFVINSRSDRKGSSGIAPRDGSVSLINIVLEPHGLDPHFIQHLFKSYFFKEEFFRNGKGIHWDLWTTRWDQFKNINIPIPKIKEQKLISRYLDKKTGQIDHLVKKIQHKIELLKEQRISLIDKCVTKGLDPNVEMKDSNVEWIGDIPKHWEKSRVKYKCTLKTGNSLNENQKEIYSSEDPLKIPYISSKNIDLKTRLINYESGIRLPANEQGFIIAPIGSFLIVVEGGSTGNKIGYLDRNVYFVNKLCSIFNLDQTKFIYYYFQSNIIKSFFESSIVGLIGGVSVFDIGNFFLPLPPIEEQKKISLYLEKKIYNSDILILKNEKRIELLKEYRQSLISSVVTGKVRVSEDMI